MKVQVQKGAMVSLPKQAMELWGIKEQDFLECSLTQAGILLTPVAPAHRAVVSKKN